jgi:esterase/lipase superfamily enzyme
MTKYWISVRKVQGDRFTNEPDLGATRYLRVPDNEVPAPRHQIGVAQWTREIVASFPKPEGCPKGDILFFVHGYNESIGDVDSRHQLIKAGLTANNFSCMVISFDWASGQTALAYLQDRDHARLTALRIVNAGVKLFVRAQDLDCDINVHTLAHSMGAHLQRAKRSITPTMGNRPQRTGRSASSS